MCLVMALRARQADRVQFEDAMLSAPHLGSPGTAPQTDGCCISFSFVIPTATMQQLQQLPDVLPVQHSHVVRLKEGRPAS